MPKKILNSKDVAKIMLEMFDKKINLLEKDMKLKLQDKNDGTLLVADGLKVHHRKSGILYTVAAVSKQEVELLTPEGKSFIVDGDTFQKDYEL
jgi:hypothetical protein